MFHLLLKTPSSLLLLFLHDNRVKSSKWNFWDYISLFTFKEESVDRWSPGNVHFPFLCLSCWRFVLPLMIFPETLCNSCWVIIGDKNALFPLSPSQPFFLHLLFIFHPEVVLLKKKKYWDCCRYRCRRKKLLHKISQVFPSIPKYSQVYLNIPLFHPQEDPSRMELSLGQPDKEKIAKTAWEGNSTIICSDFEQSLCWSNLCPRRSSSPLLVTTLLISGWEIRLLGVFTGQEDLLR